MGTTAEHLPEMGNSASPRRGGADWVSQTTKNMGSARELRKALDMEVAPDRVQQRDASSFNKLKESNVTALEEKRKRRLRAEKDIGTTLLDRMDALTVTQQRVVQINGELGRFSGKMWAALNLAEKRIEMRRGMPKEEQVQDEWQDALEVELKELSDAHKVICSWIEKGKKMQTAVEAGMADMNDQRLTLHLDRTSFPKEFLDEMRTLNQDAVKYCSDLAEVMESSEKIIVRAAKKTDRGEKKRMADLKQLRSYLTKELEDTKASITEAEKQVEKLAKVIREHDARPENQLVEEGGVDFATFWKNAKLTVAQLKSVAAAVQKAAYTGQGGRKLDVVFARADRDGSGELDEDEVRRVIRCTLKLSPSVVSDCEISALCETLDTDKSGAVTIKELVAFLNADQNVELMREQHKRVHDILKQLYQTRNSLVADLRNKRNAWLIDRAAAQAGVAEALEVDHQLDKKEQSPGSSPRRRKPLEPRLVGKLQTKLQQATRGRPVEGIFSQYDTDGSGQLDDHEFRKVLRASLGIPTYSISDAEISSLCAMLDADGSGAISIAEIVAFIGSSGESDSEPAKKVGTESGNQPRLKPGMRRSDMKGQKPAPQAI